MTERRDVPLARAGTAIADFCDRWFPDAFVFALIAVVIAFAGGLAIGERPLVLVEAFGGGIWALIPFTMQMAMIIITGFVVASSPPCASLIERLAALPRTGRGAVAFVALFAMLTSLLSWGFSLIFTGLLVRAIVRRVETVDFRAISAAAYLGLGSVWALGLSSSSAMMQATKSAIPADLFPITGVIPLSQTIFLPQSIALAVILVVLSVMIAYYSAPSPEHARTAQSLGIDFAPVDREEAVAPRTPAERLEQAPWLMLFVAILLAAYLLIVVRQKGFLYALDLNTFNLAFLVAGMILHWKPQRFLRSVSRAVPATAGVLIQFPFYAGIFGIISKTSISHRLSEFFISIATHDTFNPIVSIYSAILGVFIPSGGGKWIVEAPYVISAAKELQMHLGWTIQTYNAAEALPNLLNPFFMLPLMGILNARAKDLAGYSILQLMFHTPVVLVVCWLFAYTLPYIPPMMK